MYSRVYPVPGYGLAMWPWARYWPSLYLLFCKMGIRTCLHELLQKVTLWLPGVHRSVTTWEQSEHRAPFLLNPQYFPCSAGVWWCLVGLCPGNRVSWQQRISAGCAGGLGLLISLSQVSTSRVQRYQNPCQGKTLTSHFSQSTYPWQCGLGWVFKWATEDPPSACTPWILSCLSVQLSTKH